MLQIAVSPVCSIKLCMWFISNLLYVNNYKLHIYQFCNKDRWSCSFS